MKITAKDIRFLYNTVVISIVVVAVILSFAPYLDVNNPSLDQIIKTEHETVTLAPKQVPELIRLQNGKPVMLILYASWCGYCHALLPEVLELQRDHQLGKLEPLFVSIDAQPRLLSKYLVYHGYEKLFSPYRVDEGAFSRLTTALRPTGSTYEGAIPYVGFFTPAGKLVAEFEGFVNKQSLLDAIQTNIFE